MHMKKGILFVMLSLFCVVTMQAQKMTDDQVVEYVMEAQSKGADQQQIAAELLHQGVTMDQMNRIRRKMNSQKNAGVGQTLEKKVRTRTAPQNNGALNLPKTDVKNQEQLKASMGDEVGLMLPDSLTMLEAMNQKKMEIFGHRIFQNKEVAFEAAYNLPTPPNYKLGPGDEVAVDIWGASEYSIMEIISPDGNIYVESLGPVHLSGLTVEQANNQLKRQFGKIYSGVDGEEPNSNIRLTLAQNRTIQVHVMGEVENPGTYTMSSFATVFNALYQAGGVNEVGTLREVKIFRDDKPVATYDVYDFILNGKTDKGIRLEDNDVVSVDAYKNLVNVTGKVKRPMYYEMLDNETVAQLLKYAGGFSGNAYKDDVRLVRNGKREREIYTLNADEQQSFKIADGDSVSVDSIMTSFANMVEVKGAVYRPGTFQMNGRVTTVKQLIECAGGLKDDAFMDRAILNRRNPNNTLENLAIDLKALMAGGIADVTLRKNDVLMIPSIFDLQEVPTVTIFGEVAFPGVYEYADNMTIEDFILKAGGLNEMASTARVNVSRRVKNSSATSVSDTITHTFAFSLDNGLSVDDHKEFILKPYDEVYVRKSPGYYKQENVTIEGEVLFGGTYVLTRKDQRLSDMVKEAGGLTPHAYVEGARLIRKMDADELLRLDERIDNELEKAKNLRDSVAIRNTFLNQTEYTVGIELHKALEKPGKAADIILRDGDRIIVPQYLNTVKINGEVMSSGSVIPFEKGRRVNYYVDYAGGYSNDAKKSKVYIKYPNGKVARAKKNSPDAVQPGCEIIVPKNNKERLKTTEILALSSTSASLATVIITLATRILN
mgnify:CR=1 FL=1